LPGAGLAKFRRGAYFWAVRFAGTGPAGRGELPEAGRKKFLIVVEPIGMFVPIVRKYFFLSACITAAVGPRNALTERPAVIANLGTGRWRKLAGGGDPRLEKSYLRRNGVMLPREIGRSQDYFEARARRFPGGNAWAANSGFWAGFSEKKSPDLLLESFCYGSRKRIGWKATMAGFRWARRIGNGRGRPGRVRREAKAVELGAWSLAVRYSEA